MLAEKIQQYNRNQLCERLEAIQTLARDVRRQVLGVPSRQMENQNKNMCFNRLNQIIDLCSETKVLLHE
ncbi:MAG TPA: hypothetical protein PK572_09545 [Kiritimatiellia bacterium]|jgi:hypothetical protein|nr:hypothetical protein [bacterium]HQM23855.1 hypothetical protein [Kiritimatiellia bacterium]